MNKRDVSAEFIKAMEEGLQHGRAQNRTGWDTGWLGEDYIPLIVMLRKKLAEEIKELDELIESSLEAEDNSALTVSSEFDAMAIKEGSDVANIAMMITDILRERGLE